MLAHYLWPLRYRALLLGGLLLGATGLQLVGPQLISRFIDSATGHGSLQGLIVLAVAYIAVALCGQALSVGATYAGEWVGWKATNAMRADLAEHCLGLDMSFHQEHTPGEMIERIDGDIHTLSNFFSRFVILMLGSMLYLVGVMVLLWLVDWRVGAATGLFALVSVIVLTRLQSISVPYNQRERQASAELYGFLEERMAGVADIRSNGASSYVMNRFYHFMRNLFSKGKGAGLMESVTWSATTGLFIVSLGMALAMAMLLFRSGEVTLGVAYLIWNYIYQLRWPIQQVSEQLQDLQKATASINRVQQVYAERSEIEDGPGVDLPETTLSVEFRDVDFAYDVDDPVLRDVSFRLEEGSVLGLLGRTGSGKSTIAKLLFRLHDVNSGGVLLGGEDVRDFRLADLHSRVGMVTQHVQLVQGTVRDNLTLFDTSIPDERILAAVEEVGLSGWLEGLPDGLDSELSASGLGLSAGEEQLLAFARVFLQGPSVVVLDEASSRLDPATEMRLEHAVDRLLEGRTAIIIAHRLSTVRRADYVMVLEAGRVLEYGKREELESDPTTRFHALLRIGKEVLA